MLQIKKQLPYILFFVFATIFILVVLKGLTIAQPGDENVYYYMAKLINEGKIPYKDFFFAHPPLHIYLLALIYKIFGFNIIALKSIPLFANLITAFFIFKIAKEKFGNAEAIISSALFFFSYGIMFNSAFSFGISVATMFLIIGIYLLWIKKDYFLSGIFFGIAGITRLLSLVPVLVILVIVLFSDKKKFLRLSSGFLIVFLLVNGVFVLFLGDNYTTPVYTYHLLKSFGEGENFKEYFGIIKLNWILFAAAALAVFTGKKKFIGTFSIIVIVYLVFLLTLKRIFGFYFVVVFPFLALIAGYAIVKVFERLNVQRKWKILISVVLLLVFAWNLTPDILFLEKVGFVGFERGGDLRDFIITNSNENTLLFGDDSVVPLLALMTNKKIAFDVVDTNDQVFSTEVIDINKILNNLKGNDVLFIVRDRHGISQFSDVRSFLNNDCDLLSRFHDEIEGSYLVYSCV